MATSFEDKCVILGQLWMNHREDYGFKEFIEYNDIGLPLAFMISEGIVEDPNEAAHSFVTEAFDIFIRALEIEDSGFTSLEEILDIVSEEDI